MPLKKIGILGGVFDPIHCGHLAVAAMARESLGLDRIVFIPSGTPPHKSSVTAASDDRLNMLRLALADVNWGDIWEGEIRREGYSYTIDTLRELDIVYEGAKIYFIIGADNLADIHRWHSYDEIINLATLCVTERPGYDLERLDTLAAADIKTFPGPEWGLSSTVVRSYIKSGYSCMFMIPDAVFTYIRDRGLYGYVHK
ncbi:MAG: nicotinate-nucleotide adenylyltransferase [Chitinispirillales bacterium]|jgi:nicotinate-nucleotide adenylyltransferase|nr:nicotinate-nucleotide adenylyltransferase [Chitinispirillales bacterium]